MAGSDPQKAARATPAMPALSDNRRQWLRMDDRLPLECRKLPDTEAAAARREPPDDKAVAAFIAQSTAHLLSRIQQEGGDPTLVPWLMKIDWTLELILKTLLRVAPDSVPMPTLNDLNISAGGVRFTTDQPMKPSEQISLQFILPPFTPVQTKAEVMRVMPVDGPRPLFQVATRFLELREEDRERIIRHVFSLNAAQLRGFYARQEELSGR
jgi:hypothetical protein